MIAAAVVITLIVAFASVVELRARRRDRAAVMTEPFFDTAPQDGREREAKELLPDAPDRVEPHSEIIPASGRNSAPAAALAATSTITIEDSFARDAAEASDRWERAREKIERAHDERIRPMLERLGNARKIVEDSGVANAACDLLRVMWRWPIWSKRDDWHLPMAIEGFACGETFDENREQETVWFSWSLSGDRFRLSLDGGTSQRPQDRSTRELGLWVGEDQVLQLEIARDFDEEPDRWSAVDVSALRTGPWMAQLNEFAGRLKIADRQWIHDYEAVYFGERTRNIAIS